MSIWDGLVQGIIQGLTEFLPISSSGHLSLYQYFTGSAAGEGVLFFNLMLHLGTLAAVIAAFYEDIWALVKALGRLVRDIFTGRFRLKSNDPDRKLLFMLVVACLPMVLIIPLRSLVATVSGDRDIIVEGVCFLVTSALLFAACRQRPGRAGIGRMKARHALTIGVVQAVAVMPGISRSGSTTATGMLMGFDRAFVVKFSFLLGIPAILGGAVFEIDDAVKEKTDIGLGTLFVGMLAAAVVGYVCIRLVRWLVLSDKFIIFAWYTLVLGAFVLIAGIIGHLMGGGAPAADPASVGQGVSGSSISQAISDAVSQSGAV